MRPRNGRGEWGAGHHPGREECQPGRRRSDPTGRHSQTHDDVSPVPRPRHGASFADARPDSKPGAFSLRRTAGRRRRLGDAVTPSLPGGLVFVRGPGSALLVLRSAGAWSRRRDRARPAPSQRLRRCPFSRRSAAWRAWTPFELSSRPTSRASRSAPRARPRGRRADRPRAVSPRPSFEPLADAVQSPRTTARRGRSTRRSECVLARVGEFRDGVCVLGVFVVRATPRR